MHTHVRWSARLCLVAAAEVAAYKKNDDDHDDDDDDDDDGRIQVERERERERGARREEREEAISRVFQINSNNNDEL